MGEQTGSRVWEQVTNIGVAVINLVEEQFLNVHFLARGIFLIGAFPMGAVVNIGELHFVIRSRYEYLGGKRMDEAFIG